VAFSDWSVIAELISAVGVIISLIYLAVQIRHATKQRDAQGLQLLRAEYLSSIDNCTCTRENAEIFHKGLNKFGDMPAVEQAYFHSLIHPLLHGFHSLWEAHKAGIVSTSDLVATRDQFVSLLLTSGGRQWWESFKHVPPPGIVSYMDDSIEGSKMHLKPANESVPWLRPVE
jgi:hypothetical protein